MLKKRLTLHGDISSHCLFLSYSIACDTNIFSSIVRVNTGDFQLFGATQMNPRFFPSYLRFRKTRRITIQNQRGRRINCYILWHFCKLDGNWAKEKNNKIFTPQHQSAIWFKTIHFIRYRNKIIKYSIYIRTISKKGNKLSLCELIRICISFEIL